MTDAAVTVRDVGRSSLCREVSEVCRPTCLKPGLLGAQRDHPVLVHEVDRIPSPSHRHAPLIPSATIARLLSEETEAVAARLRELGIEQDE
jgi:hypothetical protein